VLSHFGIWEEAAVEIADQLRAVGVRVRRLPAYSNAALETAIRKHAHAYIYAWVPDFPDPGSGFLEPLLRWGPWLYRDERLERLLTGAASLRDRDERLRTYREFELIWIGEQAAVVPLGYADRPLWRRPWVTGLWANAIARSSFAEAVVRRES
jgi:ABC-type transport system substrate-binding protein